MDSLALQSVFYRIDSSLTLMEAKALIDISQNVPEKSEETLVEALHTLLIPESRFSGYGLQLPIADASDRIDRWSGKGDIAARDAFHRAILELNQRLDELTVGGVNLAIESLIGTSRNDLILAATNPDPTNTSAIAYRYALVALNPFAVIGADYTLHNRNGELDLYDPTDRTGSLTQAWIESRAEMLYWDILANTEDTNFVARPDAPDVRFEDVSSNTVTTVRDINSSIPVTSVLPRKVFGADSADALTGAAEADHLFGSGDTDVLQGRAGDDYVEGGAGLDVYQYSASESGINSNDGADTILDTDGRGVLRYRYNPGALSPRIDTVIADASVKLSNNQWKSADGRFIYTREGTDLRITLNDAAGGSMLLKDWQEGDFHIHLMEERAQPQSTRDIVGDREYLDSDPAADGIQLTRDDLGNYVLTDTPNVNSDDVLYGDRPDAQAAPDVPGEHIVAGGGHDVIFADLPISKANNGLGNADWIEAGEGRDNVVAGPGNDYVEGGFDGRKDNQWGGDLIDAGAGDDIIFGDYRMTLAQAVSGSGFGTPSGLMGDFLYGGTGDDWLIGGSSDDVLNGGPGRDLIVGAAGDDVIDGDIVQRALQLDWTLTRSLINQEGQIDYVVTIIGSQLEGGSDVDDGDADVIYAGIGDDVIYGRGGDDFVDAGSGDDFVFGGAGEDVLIGGSGNDHLAGDKPAPSASDAADYLDGGAGNDTLRAGGGDDVLIGGRGNDILQGGEGKDTYIFNKGDGVEIVFDTSDTDTANVSEQSVLIFGDDIKPENIKFRLGSLMIDLGDGDAIHFEGFNPDDPLSTVVLGEIRFSDGTSMNYRDVLEQGFDIDGTEGNDNGQTGQPPVLVGTAVTDRIRGLGGNDILAGLGGDDTLDGGAGADILQGGAGDDTYLLDRHDTVFDTEGANHLRFIDATQIDEIDIARTQSGAAEYFSLSIDERELLRTAYSQPTYATLTFGQDPALSFEDLLRRRFFERQILSGSAADDTLHGYAGDDVLDGGAGHDTLNGHFGADALTGGSGDDTLDGGAGNDVLAGGEGSDTYTFGTGSGQDTLREDGPASDTDLISMAGGLTAADLLLTRQANGDLEVALIGSSDDRLTVAGYYRNIRGQIESITFADGTSIGKSFLDALQVLPITGTEGDDALTGTNWNDTLLGLGGNDTLDGGKGHDGLEGGEGLDTYVLDYAAGMDIVVDTGGTLRLSPAVTFDTIDATRSVDDLLLTVRGTGHGLRITGYFNAPQNWAIADANAQPGSIDALLLATEHINSDAFRRAAADYEASRRAAFVGGYQALGFQLTGDATLQYSDREVAAGYVDGTQTLTTVITYFSDPAHPSTSTQPLSLDNWALEGLPIVSDNTVALRKEVVVSDAALISTGTNFEYQTSSQSVWATAAWQDLGSQNFSSSLGTAGFLRGGEIDPNTGRQEVLGTVQTTSVLNYAVGSALGQITTLHPGESFVPPLSSQLYPDMVQVTWHQDSSTEWIWEVRAGDSDNVIEFADIVDAGGGNDVVQAAYVAYGGDGNDTLYGFNQLFGGAGDDELVNAYFQSGGSGNDTLTDGAVIEGGAGDDRMDGGAGADRYLINPAEAGVDLVADSSGLISEEFLDAYYRSIGIPDWRSLLLGAEQYSIWRGEGPTFASEQEARDFFTVRGLSYEDALASGDVVILPPRPHAPIVAANDYGALQPYYQSGAIKLDRIEFGSGITTNDLVLSWGQALADFGNFDDGDTQRQHLTLDIAWGDVRQSVRVVLPRSTDLIGSGIEQFSFADGSVKSLAQMIAFAPSRDLSATENSNLLVGGAGNDSILGMGGDDELEGVGGNDTLDGGMGSDVLDGGAGTDVLIGGQGDDRLTDSSGKSAITGDAGDDRIRLEGNAEASFISGDQGNDEIEVGAADSVLSFNIGDGNDTIRFRNPLTLSLGGGIDVAQLSLRLEDEFVVLEVGTTDSIAIRYLADAALADWPQIALQIINSEIRTYDLNEAIDNLRAAHALNPAVVQIEMGSVLPGLQQTVSLDEAVGGALAYQYATTGGITGLSPAQARTVIGSESFGVGPQPVVLIANGAPVVAAGIEDQAANEDAVFNFVIPQGTFYDPDITDVLTYSAALDNDSILPSWLNFDAATGSFSGTPLNADVGSISVRVAATDSFGETASVDFILAIANTNDPPRVGVPIPPRTVSQDVPFSVQVPADAFVDEDAGDILSFSATLADGSPLPGWLVFDSVSGILSGTQSSSDLGPLSLHVTATDAAGAFATSAFALTVSAPGGAFWGTPGDDVLIGSAGDDYLFGLSGNDMLVAGAGNDYVLAEDGNDILITGAGSDYAAATGPHNFIDLGADDDITDASGRSIAVGGRGNDTLSFHEDGNVALFNSGDGLDQVSSHEGELLAISLGGVGVEDLTLSIDESAFVLRMQIDATDAISFNLFNAYVPQWWPQATLQLIGADIRTYDLTAVVGEFHLARQQDPGLVDWSAATALSANLLSVSTNEAIGGNIAYRYATTGNVESLSYAEIREIIAHPGFGTAGQPVTSAPANLPPTIAKAMPDQEAAEGAAFSFQFAADSFADADTGDALNYSASLVGGGGLPSWLVFDAQSRTFSGTPGKDDVGRISVRLTATDSDDASVSDVFDITVANVNNTPSVANVPADQLATEDTAFSFVVASDSFADADAGDTLGYEAALTNGTPLPAWLSFDAATRAFSGTPTAADIGTVVVRVTATDAEFAAASDEFVLTVNPVPGQILNGGAGADTLAGNKGNDTLNAGAGDDVLAGGAGNDIMNGGAGADTYLIEAGSGVDRIADISLPGEPNTLVFGPGISLGDITLGLGSLLLRVGGTGNELHLDSFDPADPFGARDIDWFEFADGTRLTYEQLLSRGLEIFGTDGADVILGSALGDAISGGAGNDVLIGGGGNDFLSGGRGVDEYRFGLGGGADVIVDAGLPGEANLIVFDAGVNPIDLALDEVGQDLVVGIGAGPDRIAIRNWATGGSGIEAFEFADGTAWNREMISGMLNRAPMAGPAIAAQNALEDAASSFSLPTDAITDPDSGDVLMFIATRADGTALSSWLTFDPVTRGFVGTPLNGDVGTIEIKVTATDPDGESAFTTFALSVLNTNDSPLAAADTISAIEGTPIANIVPALLGNDTDPDAGDTRRISAVEVTQTLGTVNLDTLTQTLTYTADAAFHNTLGAGMSATDQFTYILADAEGLTSNATVTVIVTGVNDAPGDVTLIGHSVAENAPNAVIDTLAATDPDSGDTFTYEILSGLDGGEFAIAGNVLSVGAAGLDFEAGATRRVVVRAIDSGGLSVERTLVLNVLNVNEAPVLENAIANQSATANLLFSFRVPASSFTDVDAGDTLSFVTTLSNGNPLPSWLSFDPVSRTFSGTPQSGDIGTLSVRVNARDNAGAAASDMFEINVGNPTIIGTAGNDFLIGTSASDTILGLAGNDFIDGGAGADSLIGGIGLDLYVVDNAGDIIFELPDEGIDGVVSSIGFLLPENVEALSLTGSAAISGTGNALDNVLTGNNANNTLTGGDGNDYIYGGGGVDGLIGGLGNDTYVLDGGADVITENVSEGIDSVLSSATYTLAPNVENLTLTGSSAIHGTGNTLDNVLTGNTTNNTLAGGAGDDTLIGGGGTDTLIGGIGNDTYVVNGSTDVVTENLNEGSDTVQSSVTRTLGNNFENLMLTRTAAINGTGNTLANFLVGNSAINALSGAAGNDILQGLAGNDSLSDTSGNAMLDGGGGNDTLTGGSGKELLIGGAGNDTLTTGTGADVIAFNAANGQDRVNSSTGTDNTLSVGGGIRYSDLSFTKSANNLVLKTGGTDQLTFKDWYSAGNRSVSTLQVIAESMAAFSPGGADPLLDNKVETFDFAALANAFDAAGQVNGWALTNALLDAHLAGSDSEAIGGDLAYQYGLNGSLTGIGLTPAQQVLNAPQFGTGAQTLRPIAELQQGQIRLS